MKRKIFVVFILLIIFLIGCQAQSKEIGNLQSKFNKESNAVNIDNKQVKYFLDIDYTIEGDLLRINGKTNLPNGSILAIDVDRKYRELYDEDNYSGYQLEYSTTIVNNGFFNSSVVLKDDLEFNRIKELQNMVNKNSLIKRKFEWISNKVNLGVVFTPIDGFDWISKQLSSSQPANVLDIVGKYGENMKGEYVEEIKVVYSDIPLREIKKSFDIEYPIDKKLIDSLGYQVKLYE